MGCVRGICRSLRCVGAVSPKHHLVCLLCCFCAGKAAWKLDDPAVLAAERAERLAAAAEAARRKVSNALDKKVCSCRVCAWGGRWNGLVLQSAACRSAECAQMVQRSPSSRLQLLTSTRTQRIWESVVTCVLVDGCTSWCGGTYR